MASIAGGINNSLIGKINRPLDYKDYKAEQKSLMRKAEGKALGGTGVVVGGLALLGSAAIIGPALAVGGVVVGAGLLISSAKDVVSYTQSKSEEDKATKQS